MGNHLHKFQVNLTTKARLEKTFMKIKKQYQEFNKIKKINQKTKANQTDKGHLIFNFYIKQK